MLIFLFFIIRILAILSLIGFIALLFKTASFKKSCSIIKDGFLNGMRQSGLYTPGKNKVLELYQWVPDNSLEICESSENFAQLPAMDLADWMKTGYPKSPDSESSCHIDCNCQLVCIKTKTHQM